MLQGGWDGLLLRHQRFVKGLQAMQGGSDYNALELRMYQSYLCGILLILRNRNKGIPASQGVSVMMYNVSIETGRNRKISRCPVQEKKEKGENEHKYVIRASSNYP
jgi:hypothetical protein